MKGTAKKAVTSGRLTGKVKVQPNRKRVTGPAASPKPAYSLYSTDSEDQVTSLHKGLDRCATLLSGILQAEKAEALPSLTRAEKEETAKSRPSASLRKKTSKKLPTQTAPDQKSGRSAQCAPGGTTPKTKHRSAVPAAHSGVKLQSPLKQTQTSSWSHLLSSPNPPPSQPSKCPPHPNFHSDNAPPPPQTDGQRTSDAPHTHHQECDSGEEDFVPVRDTATDTHTAVKHTRSHIETCTSKMSDMQLEPGRVDEVLQDTQSRDECSAETDVKERTVQNLLKELKTLIVGQGSVAERLLSLLEQTVFSPLMNAGSSNIQTEPNISSLHSENTQLHRHMRILQQQLNEWEKAPKQQNMETLCHSEVSTLQEELAAAQSRQQHLQDDLTELRKALQDTQSQLRDRDTKNSLLMTDLEATRSRLLDSEREKSELSLLAQQRLEEIENLKRIIQSQNSSDCPTVVDGSVSDTQTLSKHFDRHQHRQDAAENPTDRISHYLMSLGQLEPTLTEHVRVAAERDGNTQTQKGPTTVQLKDTLSHPDSRSQRSVKPAETSCERGRLLNSTLSQCDVESMWSGWSARSGSTFDTRDEAAFRDGLSALDASIASLQKTIELDLGR